MGLVSNKNFVMTNAVEAILAKPTKSPEPEFWTQKKNYGKVPKYLVKAKSTLRREREAVEEYVRMREQEVGVHSWGNTQHCFLNHIPIPCMGNRLC